MGQESMCYENYIIELLLILISFSMPKVQAIINQINSKCPFAVPEITQIFESDPERINQALKERRKDPHEYVLLRILLSDCLYKLKSKDFLKPLLEISLIDLRLEVLTQARLKICEGIILAEDAFRTNAIDKHLADISLTPNLSNDHHARIEAISAGNNFLKGDYSKAALQYLAAARMEAYVKDDSKKLELINKAIAFIFVAPISPESHKVICSLCLNEFAKKSKLFGLVSKLYKQDIFTADEIKTIQAYLPENLRIKDNEGIAKINQAAFSRNMIPIINSFSSIKINTLLRLIGLSNVDQLLLLLEKTYQKGEISIDHIKDIIYIRNTIEVSDLVKDFLVQIDDILVE